MWRDLEQLPGDIVAEHILSWITWKDVVVLSTATVQGLKAWSEAFQIWSKHLTYDLYPDFEPLVRWATRNSCFISEEHLEMNMREPEVATVINKYPAVFIKSSVTIAGNYSPHSLNPSLLAGVSKATVHWNADPEHSRVLADRCYRLEHIAMHGQDNLQHLPQILKNNRQLTSLALTVDHMSPEEPIYCALLEHSGQLRVLELESMTCSLSICVGIAQACFNLRELTLRYRVQHLDAVLEAFALHCRGLQTVAVVDNRELTARGVAAIAKHCKALHTFEYFDQEPMDDPCPGCEYLKIFARYGTPLRRIAIYGDKGEQWGTATHYQVMFSHVRELHCSLTGIGTFLVEGVRYMGQLQTLRLWYRRAVLETELSTVNAFLLAVAQHCPLLTECSIGFGMTTMVCSGTGQATVDALTVLIWSCPQLRRLVLYFTVVGFFSYHSLNPLTTALSGCVQLRELDLNSFSGSDADLVPLFTACHNLEKVRIASNFDQSAVTDLTVHALGEHCNWLETLTLARYPAITEAALVELVRKCRKLRELSVAAECATEDIAAQLKMMKGKKRFILRLWPKA